MMDRTATWSRSNGLYGYYVTLKQNVDPESPYLKKGAWWGTSENRIVFRYADVLLERAEALVQLNDGRINEAINIINQIRNRAKQSTSAISNYQSDYGVRMNVMPYTGTYNQVEALDIVKMERRIEMGMESERFFDLVRWGEQNAYSTSIMQKKLMTVLSIVVLTSLKIRMSTCLFHMHK